MIIGVPKEVKNKENRVGIVPGGVEVLVRAGHTVNIQKGAGLGAGISDEKYVAAGANIIDTADDLWASAEMVMRKLRNQSLKSTIDSEKTLSYTHIFILQQSRN